MREFEAEVVDVRLESQVERRQRWQMLLTRTEFSAGNTGILAAVARSGARLEVPVLSVVEEAGDFWHVVEKPLAAGTAVTGYVVDTVAV